MDPLTILSLVGTLLSGVSQASGAVEARQQRDVQAAIHREVELYRRLPAQSPSRGTAWLAATNLSWRLPRRQALFVGPMLSAGTQWQRDISDAIFDTEFE